jgi:hypothetical protein
VSAGDEVLERDAVDDAASPQTGDACGRTPEAPCGSRRTELEEGAWLPRVVEDGVGKEQVDFVAVDVARWKRRARWR